MKLIIILLLFIWPRENLATANHHNELAFSQYISHESPGKNQAYIRQELLITNLTPLRYLNMVPKNDEVDKPVLSDEATPCLPGEKYRPALYTTCRPGLFYFSSFGTKNIKYKLKRNNISYRAKYRDYKRGFV